MRVHTFQHHPDRLQDVEWLEARDHHRLPYGVMSVDDTRAPGGSSMNGMNLSGKPGIVQPMQMPPTLGHNKDAPVSRPGSGSVISSRAMLGGLHHHDPRV
jgi:hypothetical protein